LRRSATVSCIWIASRAAPTEWARSRGARGSFGAQREHLAVRFELRRRLRPDRFETAALSLVRAKPWIEANLAVSLSAEIAAAACGLSVQLLNRLFAREGSSIMHHVW
jgi:hypothetical protein